MKGARNGLLLIVTLGFATATLGLVVAVTLGVFWTPKSHWPFAAPTTTSTTIRTYYPIVAYKTVATGCGAANRLITDSVRDQARGVPVKSLSLDAVKKVEAIGQVADRPSFSPIDRAAADVSAALKQNAESNHRWKSVTAALKRFVAQCRLLGVPTGTAMATH